MDIAKTRRQLDAIDNELIRLFEERMTVVATIAALKKAEDLPLQDPLREAAILAKAEDRRGSVPPELTRAFLSSLLDLSIAYQRRLLAADGDDTAER